MGASDGSDEWNNEDDGDAWVDEESSDGESGDGSDGDEWYEEGSGEESSDPLNTDDLSDTAKTMVESAKSFCAGEFEEDTESEQYAVKSQGPAAFVTLDEETGAAVTEKVLEAYIAVLKDGGASYVPSDSDEYITPELNMIKESMMKVFALDGDLEVTEGMWADYSAEDRLALYDDTMDFFEDLYGENPDDYAGTDDTEGTAEESGSADETYYEEEGSYEEEGPYEEESYSEEEIPEA